mmetsp:Transcript_19579/g.41924  ORF Transcript_19579/g.41924 Transcript_19579/m.41924 type:complete len:220 (-) Transcript_19579:1216-1875(-)
MVMSSGSSSSSFAPSRRRCASTMFSLARTPSFVPSSSLPEDRSFSTMSWDPSMVRKDRSMRLVLRRVSSAAEGLIMASSLHPTASAKNCVCNRVLNFRNLFSLLSLPAMTSVLAVSPVTQGWCNISNALILLLGFLSISLVIRSRAEGLRWRVYGCLGPSGRGFLEFLMSSSMSSSVARPLTSKGCTPVSMMYTITPSAHMSAGGSGGESRSSNASGEE